MTNLPLVLMADEAAAFLARSSETRASLTALLLTGHRDDLPVRVGSGRLQLPRWQYPTPPPTGRNPRPTPPSRPCPPRHHGGEGTGAARGDPVDFGHITRPLTDDEAAAEAQRILKSAFVRPDAEQPAQTSYRDDTPLPRFGTTPPVPQDDRRIVPAWAAGIAVASIGVGAGITGMGCGAWLVLQGLASVTLYGVLMVTLPLAGVAMVATAIGGAISKARSASTTTVYEGPVVQNTQITNTSQRGMFARTRNDVR
ncbi:hypothetical protein OHA98_41060 [Streptomyces sp. NBC_00654]|uniref:hypothetical protein n=1 Tax=Streptomyces sp. NBC_00654 TaxID=2975799 RepID=UPI0022504A52|nr:hypothetical protein [Streptomyces sp. NBC_00654]MCX4971006.1 hypothetical protein [Streptomyces sp. NBC_00654]